MKAVVRAVPIAVLRPVAGGAEALAKAMLGLRNFLSPGSKRDGDNKFKPK